MSTNHIISLALQTHTDRYRYSFEKQAEMGEKAVCICLCEPVDDLNYSNNP